MAYFPESIMPPRLKDESQDFNNSPFVINARDVNKHDEEIRSIQKFIGVASPPTMVNGFSGMGSDAVGGFSSFSSFSHIVSFSSACYPLSIKNALDDIMEKTREIRDDMVLMDSGIVVVSHPSITTSGTISFPSHWSNTTLVSVINDDNSTTTIMTDNGDADDETNDLPVIKGIVVGDASDLPESGYITLINSATIKSYSATEKYNSYTFIEDQDANSHIRKRHLGSNVEILRYSGKAGNILYNIRRRQFGTSSSPHLAGHILFKGRLSINVAPFSYLFNIDASTNKRSKNISCSLHANCQIHMDADLEYATNSGTPLYASYHAMLVKNIETIPIYDPTSTTSCGV